MTNLSKENPVYTKKKTEFADRNNKDYVELANKFINEHDSNGNFSPFDRLETMAIMMYANWLESNQFSLEKKDILALCTNEEKGIMTV